MRTEESKEENNKADPFTDNNSIVDKRTTNEPNVCIACEG